MAYSNVLIEFLVEPQLGDTVVVNVDNGVSVVPLALTAVSLRTGPGQYYAEIPQSTDQQPFYSFATAWNMDHKNVGGIDNLKATTVDIGGDLFVKITLLNSAWEFNSVVGSAITSSRVDYEITNEDAPVPKSVTATLSGGNCTTADYDLVITGGASPYSIHGAAGGIITGAGATPTIQITRGLGATINVYDSLGVVIGGISIAPPIKIVSANFTVTQVQEVGGITATIAPNIVLKPDVLPITYSINGVDYQSSGAFTGLDYDTTYTFYIKDVFDCVVTKVVVTKSEVEGSEGSETETVRYFEISNAGTLVFGKLEEFSPTVKKNFYNTLSYNEKVGLKYQLVQEFDSSDTIVQQFKSSYNYHKLTLLDGMTEKVIVPVLQAQNIGLQEKVDCKLFTTTDGGLGVYFRNGNAYVPNTTTIEGVSDYDATNLPVWSKVGQVVYVDTFGYVKIKRVATDLSRGLYLQTDAVSTSTTDVDGKIQASYNKQDYNLYEFGFDMTNISNVGRIIIEAGFNGEVEVTQVSELIKNTADCCDKILIEWNDPENKAGIVHQTGIKHLMRVDGIFVGNTQSEGEIYRGDNEFFNINQDVSSFSVMRLVVKGFKTQEKVHLGTGMENLVINGVSYKKRELASEFQGNSNLYVINGTFDRGGNMMEVEAKEVVLNPPSTSIADKPIVIQVVPSFLAAGTGALVSNGDGGFIIVYDG